MTGEQGIFCANHHGPKFVSSRARGPGAPAGARSSSEQLGAVLAAHDAEDSLFRALA